MAVEVKQIGDNDFLAVDKAQISGTNLENIKINDKEINTLAIQNKAVTRKYSRVITVQPKCTTKGNYKYTAKDGGDVEGIDYSGVKPFQWNEAVEALGHSFGPLVRDWNPTCTGAGQESQHCSRCGTKTNVRSVGPLGHDTYTTVYNYTSTGYCYNFVPCAWYPASSTTYHCRRCGATW